ncbi:MAG: 16S rRNA (cytidine(1402)-2'-O)-methyltransferase [Thermotogae bacterium]|nr:16S rRNA (cytidine(1402)-2'-O)-methyltransferase [Thermotogota bacterium]
MSGRLYVVATPIGNLEDITLRALEVLKDSDFVLCEDTRRTKALLRRYGIDVPLISFYEGNENRRLHRILNLLQEGKTLSLVSDAGTPLISDPGYRLVRACRERGIPVLPVPGPSAALAALSVSGLPTDRFAFFGFPPKKAGRRRKWLEEAGRFNGTVIFYVSPHTVRRFLKEVLEVLGDREACLCREMTKVHEEYIFGRLSEIAEKVKERGELVLVVGRGDLP